MKQKIRQNLQCILITVAVMLALFGLVLYMSADYKEIRSIIFQDKNSAKEVVPVNEKIEKDIQKVAQPVQTEKNTQVTNANLIAGDVSIELSFTDGKSLYDLLTEAENNGKIHLVLKKYPGLGFYVTEIGSLKEVEGKHLIYEVNGKDATLGISSFVPKVGDKIDWKLE